jgi:hypothetical protein
VHTNLELKSADDSNQDFAWSLYSDFVRKYMFSGAPGRRTATVWNETTENQKFREYWGEKNKYIISVDDKVIGWAAIVKHGNKITIENWQLTEAWQNKDITKIILGDLVPKWRSEGLEVEAAILQGTPMTSAAEDVLSKLGFSSHGVVRHANLMRIA